MLTSLIALGVCGVMSPTQAQTNPGTPYSPKDSPVMRIVLSAINVLKAGEKEGDEPYLLVYQSGVQIPVNRDGTLQRPKAMPVLLVGKGSFSNIRSGYDWAKPNNQLAIRGFEVNFSRLPNAYVIFCYTVFAFDHDEWNDAQLSAMKRDATTLVRESVERAVAVTDPSVLTEATQIPSILVPRNVDIFILNRIAQMSTGDPDEPIGQRTVAIRSKPLGLNPGVPEDVVRLLLSSSTNIRPMSTVPFSFDVSSIHTSSLSKFSYRGQIRLSGHISRRK